MTDPTMTGPDGVDADAAAAPAASGWSWRGAAAWSVLAVVLVLLDGWVGATVAILVAAAIVARVSMRVVGGVGVALLTAAAALVLADGLPRPSELSPAFVARSLVPHHLTFAGLALLSVAVVLDSLPHLVRARPATTPRPVDGRGRRIGTPAPVPVAVGVALVAIVALGAAAACWAVWQA